jgi:hypothetical protein
MPRKKSAPRKKSRKSKAKSGIGVYLFAALALFVFIIWLSQPEDGYKIPGLKKKVSVPVDSFLTAQKQKVEDKLKKSPHDKAPEAETETEKGILSAISKLHIASSDIKRRQKDKEITLSVPIDPSVSDLTFANMIIKGEVEQQKGEFVSGVVKGSRQVLTFLDKDSGNKFLVELYYKRGETAAKSPSRAITIIIDDFGNTKGELLTGFAKTDPAVCFAILPQTPYAVDAMKIATQYGHESIIHVPMEPINYPRENPGDHAIFIQLSEGEISRRMERFINQLPDAIGVNNHMGSLATADEPTMQVVMQSLKKHNLIFVDSRTTANSVAFKTAQKHMVPTFRRDIFLDEPDLSDATLDKKIAECLSLSQSRSYIVAIMHCHTASHLNYLNRFIARAEQHGFELVPLSRLGAYKLPEIP